MLRKKGTFLIMELVFRHFSFSLISFGLFVSVLPSLVTSFNFDVKNAINFEGPDGSYFGFSLTFHKNRQGKWLIVGAPKGNSSFETEITEPGAIYGCDLTSTSGRACREIFLDDTGNQKDRYKRMKDSKDGQWLGMTVASNIKGDGRIVACAPRWENRYFRGYFFPNGMCYEVDGDFSNNERRLSLHLSTSVNKQISDSVVPGPPIYYYAFAMMGMAATYSKDNILILGAPGGTDWRGFLVKKYENSQNINATLLETNIEANSYLGYSVGAGKFYSDGRTYFVSGAPRSEDIGKVMVYTKEFSHIFEKLGKQMGSYFGAAVCAVDLDNDGLDELLVGAPMYSHTTSDQGIVYVYRNYNLGILVETGTPLVGTKARDARFGSSIVNAGDLNNDGFHDVVIGAPYEDNGRGAVYIYHGGLKNILQHSRYAQRIAAVDINPDFSGFGYSIHAGLDVDDNKYPDLAIGVYESNAAVVLRSSPIISLDASMKFFEDKVNMQKHICIFKGELRNCTGIKVGFKFHGLQVPDNIEIQYTLKFLGVESEKKSLLRGMIEGPRQMLFPEVTRNLNLTKNVQKDQNFRIIFKKNIRDLITPVVLELSFQLVNKTEQSNSSTTLLEPVLNMYKPTTIKKETTFVLDCGEDETCYCDLSMDAKVRHSSALDYIVLGQKGQLYIDAVVSTVGEPSYITEVIVVFPKVLKFIHSKSKDKIPCILLESSTDDNEDVFLSKLFCDIGNPMAANSTKSLLLAFDTSKLDTAIEEVNITMIATTYSTEIEDDKENNIKEIIIPLHIDAKIQVTEVSVPEQIDLPPVEKHLRPVEVKHLYDIINIGPGIKPSTEMELHVPVLSNTGEKIFTALSVELLGDGVDVGGSCHKNSSKKDTTHEDFFDYNADNSTSILDDLVPSAVLDAKYGIGSLIFEEATIGILTLDCFGSNVICETFTCSVGPLLPGSSVLISVFAQLQLESVIAMKPNNELNVIEVVSDVTVFTKPSELTSKGTVINSKVVTPIYVKTKVDGLFGVSWWILGGSILAGLVMLIVIIIVLKQCGFFKRAHREELQRLLSQSSCETEFETLSPGVEIPDYIQSMDEQHGFSYNGPINLNSPTEDDTRLLTSEWVYDTNNDSPPPTYDQEGYHQNDAAPKQYYNIPKDSGYVLCNNNPEKA